MDLLRLMFGKRALALLAVVALLYFAAGGAFLHQHTADSDTACHLCQSVHVPALAAARIDLLNEVWHVTSRPVLPESPAPLDSVSKHRASRAPPSV